MDRGHDSKLLKSLQIGALVGLGKDGWQTVGWGWLRAGVVVGGMGVSVWSVGLRSTMLSWKSACTKRTTIWEMISAIAVWAQPAILAWPRHSNAFHP